MERSRIQQIIKELGLQGTQNISARAAEIGNLLGVQKIITGELIYDAKNYHWTECGIPIKVNLRLIDVESGGIEAAISTDNYSRDVNGKIMMKKRCPVFISNEEFADKILDALLN